MTPTEIAQEIAANALNFSIEKTPMGAFRLNMCGTSWEFPEDPAKAIESMMLIWSQIERGMQQVVNDTLVQWTTDNKQNFN